MNDWDSLQAEVASDAKRTHYICSVRALIDCVRHEQGDSAASSLIQTLGNHRLSTTSIRRALERRVEPVMLPSAWSIGHHRRDQCSCTKEGS